MRVVATAGHVDHGKSTLVQALTGTDPDRFPEEKARGLTIDLGFAFCPLPSGQVVGFVDVPGHVRFVKNMLAGVGAVDVALLVIAANEGWMPQTEEHVQILDLLDIHHGMVALTKAALVDDDTIELARLELEERLDWPVVVVDTPTGRGVAEVASTLDAVLAAAPAPRDDARPRLWIDRVFAAKGAGTVVTGTLTAGALARDTEVLAGAHRARVRGIESHHEKLDRVAPGARVALNLAGVDHQELQRGDAVVLPGQWEMVTQADVALRGHEFPKRGLLDAHVGSGEQRVRFRLLDDAHARITFVRPLPLAPGDRLVLRSSGRQATIGGAEILDIAPTRRSRVALPLVDRVFAAKPWCTPDEFARLAGRAPVADEAVAVGTWLTTPAELERVRTRADELTRDGWPAITTIADQCGVSVPQLRAALGDAVPASPLEDPEAEKLLAALNAEPFAPPAPANPALVRALVRAAVLVDLDGIVFTADAYAQACQRIRDALAEHGELTVSQAREALGTSRKYALPLLNRMDADGVTKRRGDTRTTGAR
jgi:selenocysteine-specific elongation factor